MLSTERPWGKTGVKVARVLCLLLLLFAVTGTHGSSDWAQGVNLTIPCTVVEADALVGDQLTVTVQGADVVVTVGEDLLAQLQAAIGLGLPVTLTVENGVVVGFEPCEDLGGEPTVPDNQQDDQQGEVKDDQQGGAKPTAPDNQQTDKGAGATVTKTFQLTLYGSVPADQAFGVVYSTSENPEELIPIALCGQAGGRLPEKDDCRGGGTVYSAGVDVEAGTVIKFVFFRVTEGDPDSYEAFSLGTETITTDMTNGAWYRFGADKDTEDDQQDTGAGDVQDDQQEVEVPKAMPSTGAGGMATGLPLGSLGAALSLLAVGGYATLRRR